MKPPPCGLGKEERENCRYTIHGIHLLYLHLRNRFDLHCKSRCVLRKIGEGGAEHGGDEKSLRKFARPVPLVKGGVDCCFWRFPLRAPEGARSRMAKNAFARDVTCRLYVFYVVSSTEGIRAHLTWAWMLLSVLTGVNAQPTAIRAVRGNLKGSRSVGIGIRRAGRWQHEARPCTCYGSRSCVRPASKQWPARETVPTRTRGLPRPN